MTINVYSTKQVPAPKHDYYVKPEGTMFPETFDPSHHDGEVAIFLESGIITPTPAQREAR